MKNRYKVLALATLAILVGAGLFFSNKRAMFVAGGAMVNLGYRLQDPLESFDFDHHEQITPEQVWKELLDQNHLSAAVRKQFPRTSRHPIVALVTCMDARIDTNELMGDTRKYYYIVRTAGSVISEKEEEMLELAVNKGVKLVVWTRHHNCAAEKAAHSEEGRQHYPHLTAAVDEREQRMMEFLHRPAISAKILEKKLMVKEISIDTKTDEMVTTTELTPSTHGTTVVFPDSSAPHPVEPTHAAASIHLQSKLARVNR